mgnify:CR=1 FL=1
MKKALVTIFIYLGFLVPSYSADYTLYLVRHAEKQTGGKDPSLTYCGQQRALQLASILSKTNIEQVYSTNYKRTIQTATPSANKHNTSIKYYSPKDLDQFSTLLQHYQKNALIVGHSNTTPQLASLLSGKKVADLTEKDYQMLYQIQFIEGKTILTELIQPLSCR